MPTDDSSKLAGDDYRGLPGMIGPLGVVTITALFYGVVIVVRLASHGFNPTFFVVAGDRFCTPQEVPEGLLVNPGEGYDGEFYYRLALRPIATSRTEFGITLDKPAYREQRILYPALVHVLAFGRPRLVPWLMILVNYFAICLLAFSAAFLADAFAVPVFYGSMVSFYPGLLLALERDLTDPLAISLMISSLTLFYYRKTLLAAIVLAAGVLARESILFLAVGLFVCSAWRAVNKQSTWKRSIPWTLPMMTYLGWLLWISFQLGVVQNQAKQESPVMLGLPFSGAFPTVVQALQSASNLHPFLLTEVLFIAGLVIGAGIMLFRSSLDAGVKLAWLGYLVLMAMFSPLEWIEDWGFLRVSSELIILSLVILISARNRRLLQLALLSELAIWACLAYQRAIPL